ncbi:MAG: VWA domain-containing protein [Acidobacteriota bacterium]
MKATAQNSKRKMLIGYLILLGLATIIVLPSRALAQAQTSQDSQEPILKVSTELVQIDVVVTDKDGRLISDLKAEDFELFESGKKQPITNFSYISRNPEDAAKVLPSLSTLTPTQVNHTIALVVDDGGLSFETIGYVRNRLKKLVDEYIQPGSLVAISRIGGELGVLQQFTNNKESLYAAISQLRWNINSRNGIYNIFDENNETQCNNPFEISTGHSINALQSIIRRLATLPGRKTLVFISDGFALFGEQLSRFNPNRSTIDNIIEMANRASINIYTIDAELLSHNHNFQKQQGLLYLANLTGGFFSSNLEASLKRIAKEQSGYYLIGYIPEEATFKGDINSRSFRNIKVKVKRKDLMVRSRVGFYAVTDAEMQLARSQENNSLLALTSPFMIDKIPLKMTTIFRQQQQQSILRSLVHIDASKLHFAQELDGKNKATFDLDIYLFGDNGRVSYHANRNHSLYLTGNTYQQVLKDGFVYIVNVPVKQAGGYQLRIVVKDTNSQELGSVYQFVNIPMIKKQQPLLSGIFLSTKESEQTAIDKEINDIDKISGEIDSQGSAAVLRRYYQGTVLNYTYDIYNISSLNRSKPLTAQVILFHKGKAVFTGPKQPIDTTKQKNPEKTAINGIVPQSSELTTGEYVLQIRVDQAGSKRPIFQQIDFEIIDR